MLNSPSPLLRALSGRSSSGLPYTPQAWPGIVSPSARLPHPFFYYNLARCGTRWPQSPMTSSRPAVNHFRTQTVKYTKGLQIYQDISTRLFTYTEWQINTKGSHLKAVIFYVITGPNNVHPICAVLTWQCNSLIKRQISLPTLTTAKLNSCRHKTYILFNN